MKRRDDAKEKFCGRRSQLDPIPTIDNEEYDAKIPVDLKFRRLDAKFLLNTNQKKRRDRDFIDNEEYDEKVRSPDAKIPIDQKFRRLDAKFLLKTHQKKRRDRDFIDNKEYDEKVRSPDAKIPVDLVVEILTRLPAKSLMKFRCVSKELSSIIRSQNFTDSFFAKRLRSPSQFIIAFTNALSAEEEEERLFIFTSSYEKEESSSLIANLEMTVPSVTLDYHTSKSTSIHGFFCFRAGHFYVCNPCTGEVIRLPWVGRPSMCIGYDPVDSRFKVLTLLSSPLHNLDFLVHEVATRVGGGWRRNQVISPPYYPVTQGLCINGFVYWGAWAPRHRMNPVVMCFDVRSESFSIIPAPRDVVYYESDSILIEYNGKLASIVRYPYSTVTSFDLWILEDVETHDWSKQTFQLPFPICTTRKITSPGTNKAGEIIFAPQCLSRDVEPFYIFYYNVQRKDMRRVRIHGIADTQEFRRRYGLIDSGCVSIAPQHHECISLF